MQHNKSKYETQHVLGNILFLKVKKELTHNVGRRASM